MQIESHFTLQKLGEKNMCEENLEVTLCPTLGVIYSSTVLVEVFGTKIGM
jgi:hypothetical protein